MHRAFGFWLLAFGFWLLAFGLKVRCVFTLFLCHCSGTLILQSSIGGKLSQKEDIKMRRTFSPDYKVAAVKLVTEQG
ncbi:hypothetical protein, partial [Gallibacterium anatis]|uniref:hypothetical protein n=1 Tax=Gallibacterium anatis TaxID=750 RepID=UPI00057FF18D